MSLWDTDKNSDKRTRPELNQRDELTMRTAYGTSSVNPVTDATTGQYLTNTNGTFRIVASETASVTTNSISGNAVGIYVGGSVITTIAHNLGYVPTVIASEGDGGGGLLPFLNIVTQGGAGNPNNVERFDEITYSVDTTNLYLIANQYLRIFVAGAQTVSGTTYSIKYYLLKETAN